MTTLDVATPGELRLVLRGAAENSVLNTLRHWPNWSRVELEPDPMDASQYLSVTLITGRNQETTIREILRRSFGMSFSPEGGESGIKVEAESDAPRKKGRIRRD